MQLTAQAKKATLLCSFEAEKASPQLIVECSAIKDTGVFEIGERHAFGLKPALSILASRRYCDLRLAVRQRGSLTQKNIEKLELSENKIGQLSFCPPYKGDGIGFSSPGELGAEIFVTNELFEMLSNTLQARRKSTQVCLELGMPDAIRFGWEPDGSRKVWKLESTTETSSVAIESFHLWAGLF